MLSTVAIIALLLSTLIWLVGRGGVVRTREDVAQYIEDFVQGRGGERDWDEFTSVRIKDPYLDRMRRQCLEAERNMAALRALLAELRGRAA